MKNYALLLFFLAFGLANYGCDKCADIECTPPPPGFSFQLLDKDSGQDLVANGTFNAKQVKVFSIADNKLHTMFVTVSADSTAYTFTDGELGWNTGPENASYELRLNASSVFPFTFETKSVKDGCCTAIKLEKFEIEGVERLFNPQTGLFQFRI
ncbi:MAG: hypothetical protein IT258_19370 [Saprospiraceae bacterium]|nr:hypothetical protein [Saprospiraceae bacterium]